MRANQKFRRGDLVRIADDLGPHMVHFRKSCEVIVLGSFDDLYGGGREDCHTYSVFFKDQGSCSWYEEGQLTLVAEGQHARLAEWELALEADWKQKADLDWIFAHGEEVVARGYTASLQALADTFNFGSLWGRFGEGIDLHANSAWLVVRAAPFLRTGDKIGWLAFAENLKTLNIQPRSTNFHAAELTRFRG